jgi:hypothetical protein
MKTQYALALAVVAGFGLVAITVHGLCAQAKPPVYVISEIDVTDLDAYMKEFVPQVRAGVTAAGGRFIAAGGPKKSSVR